MVIDIEVVFLEYFDMFYNFGIVGWVMCCIGVVEFVMMIVFGLCDVLFIGKIKEMVVCFDKNKLLVYDVIVVDVFLIGCIVCFLDVIKVVFDLVKGGLVYV